jgi:RNA polymerase sigma-70 factor, ECF subfamily
MDDTSEVARALFRDHGAALYRFAAVLVHQHQDAEDVVQETFLKLLAHLDAERDLANPRGWLFTVAAHAARDRQRRRRRWMPWRPVHDGRVPPPRLPDEDGRLTRARAALQRLPERDRLLLLLRAQGLSYRDIAAAAGLNPASVGRLLARAVDRWAARPGRPRANEHQRESHASGAGTMGPPRASVLGSPRGEAPRNEYDLLERQSNPGAR